MILHIASFIIFVFVSASLFFRAGCPAALKLAGSALILAISMKYMIYRVIGGAFFSPELPWTLILGLEFMYGALFVLFVLLLLWDVYLAGNWLLSRAGFPVPVHLRAGAIKCGLVALALALGMWGTWQGVKVPEARTVEIPIAGLPKALDGFRIAQLSDLHIGPLLKKDWLMAVVERTNSLNPDLVALTGDFVDGRARDIGDELSPLAALRARYGVFGVTGNHEYYWNAQEWLEALRGLNITMLENGHRALDVRGETLVLAGIPDLAAARFGLKTPDLPAALDKAPEATRILLAHNPRNALEHLEHVDLQLSGHTHGGTMFFLKPLIARFNSGFVAGNYNMAGKYLHVSPGTGIWNGFSCRIGVPAEITLLILKTA